MPPRTVRGHRSRPGRTAPSPCPSNRPAPSRRPRDRAPPARRWERRERHRAPAPGVAATPRSLLRRRGRRPPQTLLALTVALDRDMRGRATAGIELDPSEAETGPGDQRAAEAPAWRRSPPGGTRGALRPLRADHRVGRPAAPPSTVRRRGRSRLRGPRTCGTAPPPPQPSGLDRRSRTVQGRRPPRRTRPTTGRDSPLPAPHGPGLRPLPPVRPGRRSRRRQWRCGPGEGERVRSPRRSGRECRRRRRRAWRGRSRPTFLMTLPPARAIVPSDSTTVTPTTRSRTPPYLWRSGPESLVATIPPIVAPPSPPRSPRRRRRRPMATMAGRAPASVRRRRRLPAPPTAACPPGERQ